MPLRVRCECGETLTVPENKAGMQVLCPLCNRQVTIPPPRPASPPPPPPGPPVNPSRPQPAKPAGGEGPSQAKRPQPRPAVPRRAPAPPPAPPSPPPRKSRKGKNASEVAKPQPATKDAAKPTAAPPPLPSTRPRSEDAQPAAIEKSDVTMSDSPIPSPAAPIKPVRPPQPARPQAMDTRKTPPPVPPPARETATTKEETSSAAQPKPESLPGVEHDPGKKWTVYQLGMAVAMLGLAGMYPSIAEVVRHITDFDSTGIEAWAYFVFLLTGIQLVYALYLVQLPDWSTLFVVMIVCACVTVFYATAMGLSMMAGKDNALIGSLGLTAAQENGYLSLWCLMMMLLAALLTYALVRASVKWQKSFELAMAGREDM